MADSGKRWYDRPLRIVQTVLREVDILGYDPAKVMEYVQRLKGNVLIVNGGGLWAFYPTDVPGHRRVAGMSPDILRELRDITAAKGIRLIARVDFRGGHREMFEAHPDWFSFDRDGKPIMMNGLYVTDPTSPYRNEGYGFQVVREILERYDVDGIWENALFFGPLSYGRDLERRFLRDTGSELPRKELSDSAYRRCIESFRRETGSELPRGYELPCKEWLDDPAYREYIEWRYTCVWRHSEDLRQLVKSFGYDKAYVAEAAALLEFPDWLSFVATDIAQLGPLWDIVTAPTFAVLKGSRGSGLWPAPVWRSEEVTKYLRGTVPGKPATIHFYPFDNSSRYTSVIGQELRLLLAGALAHGGSFWVCTFVGSHGGEFLDQRNQDIISEFYDLLEQNEDVFDDVQPVADVALVYLRAAEERYGSADPSEDGYVQHLRGFELALFENHIPFDILPESRINAETLGKYEVVVLANAALLSLEHQALIREYVRDGGGLVSSYETSLYDSDLRQRDDFGLADVFGVRNLGVRYGPLAYGYSQIRQRNELTVGLEETEVCTNNGYIWLTAAALDAVVPVTLVPEVSPQPPERGWRESMESDLPVMVAREFGEGRSVFFPGQTDKLFAADGHPDYGILLRNALRWTARNREPLVETNAPHAVHVSVTRHSDGRLVTHLLNYCGGYRRPVTATQPVQNVSIRLRCEQAPVSATLLRSREPVEFDWAQGYVRFTVPVVDDYEAIVIDVVRMTAGPE